ncbi:MAG: hypothetical protein ACREN1_00465 [Candidatus Dormibacteria bacterium]
MDARRHLVIPAVIAAVLCLIADLILALVVTLPPGYASTTSSDQTVTGQIFSMVGGDVGILVVVFAVYFAIIFSRGGESTRPASVLSTRAGTSLSIGWISACTVLIFFAAGFGVVELEGQTAPSLVVTSQALARGAQNHPFIVQVIGQQWEWTYRYPQYGGFETQQLRIPTNRLVEFNVTSLDVTHQFWAYQLGIKLDANQGVNNQGYVFVLKPTVIDVRCGELCGLWHGYMTDVGSQAGQALGPSAFSSWLRYAKALYGPQVKNLPKYALTYVPQPAIYGS